MTYTFWQSGILIGESDLEDSPDGPRHRSGVFRPTPYGRELFPRLTGMLTAGYALKNHLDARGLSPDDMAPHEIEEVLDTTAAGQKVLDIGRTLSEVEVRAPDGRPMEIVSIAFIDTEEFDGLLRAMNLRDARDAENLPVPPANANRYAVSATFHEDAPRHARPRLGAPFPRRHWSTDN